MLNDPGIGEQVANAALLSARHVLRTDFQPTQLLAGLADDCRVPQQNPQEGRHGGKGIDLIRLEHSRQLERIKAARRQVGSTACGADRADAANAETVGHRHADIFTDVRCQAHLLDDPLRRIRQVRVAQDNALWLALGTGGVGDLGRPVIVDERVTCRKPAGSLIGNDAALDTDACQRLGKGLIRNVDQWLARFVERKHMFKIGQGILRNERGSR